MQDGTSIEAGGTIYNTSLALVRAWEGRLVGKSRDVLKALRVDAITALEERLVKPGTEHSKAALVLAVDNILGD